MSADETKVCRDDNCLRYQRHGTPFVCYCPDETKVGHGFEGECEDDRHDFVDYCHAPVEGECCGLPRSAHPGEERPCRFVAEPGEEDDCATHFKAGKTCRRERRHLAPAGIAESRFCNEKFMDGPVEKACVLSPQHPGDQHSPYLPMAGIAEEPGDLIEETARFIALWREGNPRLAGAHRAQATRLVEHLTEKGLLRVRSEGGGEKRQEPMRLCGSHETPGDNNCALTGECCACEVADATCEYHAHFTCKAQNARLTAENVLARDEASQGRSLVAALRAEIERLKGERDEASAWRELWTGAERVLDTYYPERQGNPHDRVFLLGQRAEADLGLLSALTIENEGLRAALTRILNLGDLDARPCNADACTGERSCPRCVARAALDLSESR